jgi:hypothetical protein
VLAITTDRRVAAAFAQDAEEQYERSPTMAISPSDRGNKTTGRAGVPSTESGSLVEVIATSGA